MGGAYCPSCGPREVSALPIGVDTLKLLRYLQRSPVVEFLAVRPAEPIERDVERLLRRQIEFVIERRLRAADFVKRVAEETARYPA